jgi:hypothetical protein
MIQAIERKQYELYAKRARQADFKTSAFLGDLQGKLMVLSQEILTLLKGQLAALEKA